MKFYHIDRAKKLSEGQVLQLNEAPAINNLIIDGNNMSEEFNAALDDLFNSRLSNHGRGYIYNLDPENTMIKMELTFELIRKIFFSNCPSRYKSFYAVGRGELGRLMDEFGENFNTCNIYEVKSDNCFKADMHLLKGDGRIIDIIYAKKYWSQEESDNPLIEYLLEYPIKVVRRIDSLDDI